MSSTLPEHPPIPGQLGPYRVLRPIGAGGMAQVHLARRYGASGWEKHVALKVLRPEYRGRAELERLLIDEARLGARFAHPNLVQVHDLGLDAGIYYLCMDYVDGADLAALLSRQALPPALALLVAEQLAATLVYVHALRDEAGRPLGLVHRDLNPGNVLLSRHGGVKLSDFGIAKATAEDDRTWGRLRKGKYAYMAPEQFEGTGLSGAVDLFALGVTLHELLLGRRPFDGVGALDTMEAIRAAVLRPNHDFGALGPELVALLRRLLARDPAQRSTQGAAEVVRALQRARWSAGQQAPSSAVDLGDWVCTVLDSPSTHDESEQPNALETLGMDEG